MCLGLIIVIRNRIHNAKKLDLISVYQWATQNWCIVAAKNYKRCTCVGQPLIHEFLYIEWQLRLQFKNSRFSDSSRFIGDERLRLLKTPHSREVSSAVRRLSITSTKEPSRESFDIHTHTYYMRSS
ncbi:unnamed protein product [Albugo candida]|uniref:Uncharacterized protein n=1 Tax=Albugo candida TaxID=65357 RepID=A0A024GHY0_9STRA|nr:unnamed protein product [Albugo candida]|eukprot:CCI46483.1 unnamed protein product [Albugo candida]